MFKNDNVLLNYLREQWAHTASTIPLACGYETERVYGVIPVVNRNSATALCQDHRDQNMILDIRGDHLDIVKPKDSDSSERGNTPLKFLRAAYGQHPVEPDYTNAIDLKCTKHVGIRCAECGGDGAAAAVSGRFNHVPAYYQGGQGARFNCTNMEPESSYVVHFRATAYNVDPPNKVQQGALVRLQIGPSITKDFEPRDINHNQPWGDPIIHDFDPVPVQGTTATIMIYLLWCQSGADAMKCGLKDVEFSIATPK